MRAIAIQPKLSVIGLGYISDSLSAIAVCGPFIEELLAARNITVSYEAIRQWCQKFG